MATLAVPLLLCGIIALLHTPTANAEATKTVFNPFTGRLDFITSVNSTNFASGTGVTVTCTGGVCTFTASGGAASSLATAFNGVQITSPTAGINVLSPLVAQASASTMTLSVDLSTVAPASGSGNYIQNTSNLQSGATFYVSSGTVNSNFSTLGTTNLNSGVNINQKNSGSVSSVLNFTQKGKANGTVMSQNWFTGTGINQPLIISNTLPDGSFSEFSSLYVDPQYGVTVLGSTNNVREFSAGLTLGGPYAFAISSNSEILLSGSAGANGQFLTSAGPGSTPTWTNASVVLQSSGVAFGSASNAVTQDTNSLTWDNSIKNLNINPPSLSVAASTFVANMGTSGFTTIYQHYALSTAFSGNSLTVFDVANPTSPVMLSQRTGGALTGAEGIETSGHYAFVTSLTNNSFTVFDIASPANPIQIASIQDATNLAGAEHVRIFGNYAYIANFNSGGSNPGLAVIDISKPSSPSIAATLTNANISAPIFIQIRYPYLYLTNEDANCRLNVIDISNPTSPLLKTSFVPTGCNSNLITSDFFGRYLYLSGNGNSAIFTVDISSPLSPVSVSSVATGSYFPITLNVANNTLYWTSLVPDAIGIFSLTNPSAPVWVSTFTDAVNLGRPDDLKSDGRFLYASQHTNGSKGGLTILNMGALSIQGITAGSALVDALEVTHDIRANRAFIDSSIQTSSLWSQGMVTAATGTFVSSLTVAGQNVCQANGTNCPSSSGLVSPGTFTWTNNFGIALSTVNVSSNTILSGATFYQGAQSVIQGDVFKTDGSLGMGVNNVNGANTLEVSGNIVGDTSINSTAFFGGYFEQQTKLKPALAMSQQGTDFGFVENDATNVWDLGHGPTNTTLGTAVLSWNASNQVFGPSSSFLATASSFTELGAGGVGITYGVSASSVTASSANVTGNSLAINGLGYLWPASQSANYLKNDGAGNLTWAATAGGGASSLATAYNGTQVTSPTVGINVISPLVAVANSSTMTLSVDLSTTANLSAVGTSTASLQTQINSLGVSTGSIAASTGTIAATVFTLGQSTYSLAQATGTLYTLANGKVNYSSFSATSPINYNSGTGAISFSTVVPQAETFTGSSVTISGAGGLTAQYGITGGSGTFTSTLSIPNGAGTSVTGAGQLAVNTNAGQLMMYDGTSAKVVASSTHSFTVTISSGVGWNSLTIPVWRAPIVSSVTITEILAESLPANTTVQYQLSIDTFGKVNTLGNNVFGVNPSSASDGGYTTTSFATNVVLPQASLVLTTPSSNAGAGSPSMMTFTVYYLENKQ